MPPKSKNAPKAKHQPTPSSSQPQAPPEPPATVAARTAVRYAALWPIEQAKQQLGLHGLSGSERTSWANTHYLRAQPNLKSLPLSNKATKDLWKGFNESGIPVRGLKQSEWCWGKDRVGRDIGSYGIEEFEERAGKKAQLTRLEVQGRGFKARREKEKRFAGITGGEVREELERLSEEDFEKERERRLTVAKLRMELYGQKTGSFALDPEWDDVMPIPQEEGEGALASIAYPDDYAEAMSYLRAVMASKEYTPRTLRLTETIINMNPAHYTVWLYRFSIVQALNISITDEITWLNGVSLAHLKNYQIWHHRQLLIDHLYASVAAGHPNQDVTPASAQNNAKLADLGKTEQAFLKRMLDEDAKNYHVWSYRQYLVRKLGLFDDDSEMSAVGTLILEDVRNNSAWSHRFFLVFSNPANCSPSEGKGGELAIPVTKHDPACPSNVVDREIAYAQGKIELAPQNQSPWNYLRGLLTRGGRPAATQEGFAQQFVVGLGDGEDKEEVRSSHALDLLAEIWAETGQVEKADLALTRLGEKWDRIRAGYWEWRRRCIAEGAVAATAGGEGV